ncbi:MAG TPA: hypothetical protein VEF04_10385 [Blastocatellia bacterium]|nr:hypothetical protein [Blastocatellia bacterium]
MPGVRWLSGGKAHASWAWLMVVAPLPGWREPGAASWSRRRP